MNAIAPYRKAIIAGLAAGLAFLAPVVDDGLTWSEAISAVLAALSAAGVTWAVPNKPAE